MCRLYSILETLFSGLLLDLLDHLGSRTLDAKKLLGEKFPFARSQLLHIEQTKTDDPGILVQIAQLGMERLHLGQVHDSRY